MRKFAQATVGFWEDGFWKRHRMLAFRRIRQCDAGTLLTFQTARSTQPLITEIQGVALRCLIRLNFPILNPTGASRTSMKQGVIY